MKKILLILAAVALTTVGCNKNQAPAGGETKPAAETTESDAAAAASGTKPKPKKRMRNSPRKGAASNPT